VLLASSLPHTSDCCDAQGRFLPPLLPAPLHLVSQGALVGALAITFFLIVLSQVAYCRLFGAKKGPNKIPCKLWRLIGSLYCRLIPLSDKDITPTESLVILVTKDSNIGVSIDVHVLPLTHVKILDQWSNKIGTIHTF
jgi:hypothetical protein